MESEPSLQLVDFYESNLKLFGNFEGFLQHCCLRMESIDPYPLDQDATSKKFNLLQVEASRYFRVKEENPKLAAHSIIYSISRLFSGYKFWTKSLISSNAISFAVYLGLEEIDEKDAKLITSDDLSVVSNKHNSAFVVEVWKEAFQDIKRKLKAHYNV